MAVKKKVHSTTSWIRHLASVAHSHRKQSGLSQAELAELAGVGKTVVYDLEHAKESMRLNTILKILQVLNIQVNLASPLMDAFKAHDS